MIHFEYDGASLILFNVFDVEGRRLECFPRGGGQSIDVARAKPATRFPSGSSGSSSDAGESSDSLELLLTPKTSDDSYEPPSSCHARSRVATSGRQRG